jgi:hypothetical protein
MATPDPKIDPRTFASLIQSAWDRIDKTCPAWTDRAAGDPGVALLEMFAHLTEMTIYRLNRLPNRAYVEFLRLMGVRIRPPGAACVKLRFSRVQVGSSTDSGGSERGSPGAAPVQIPSGTRVSSASMGQDAPVFVTLQAVTIESGKDFVDVDAINAQNVDAELADIATGQGSFWVEVKRAPILAALGQEPNLIVGIEATLAEIGAAPRREFQGKTYRQWLPVDAFTVDHASDPVYVVDRNSGLILFAPEMAVSEPTAAPVDQPISDAPTPTAPRVRAAISGPQPEKTQKTVAPVPAQGREVRVWYRTGGGSAGNVKAGSLNTLKDQIPGVTVTSITDATGGCDAETLAEALARGPRELHSLRRAVTARDFQRVAEAEGVVARANAFTHAQIWRHATPGTIAIVLVPSVPKERWADGHLTRDLLREYESQEAQNRILDELNHRRPLGTTLLVDWFRYRVLGVKARVIAFTGVDASDLTSRLKKRLDAIICPLSTNLQPGGWPFGQSLHVGRVYNSMFAEAGVKDIPDVSLVVDEVPDKDAKMLTADWLQRDTWHAIANNGIYRSIDNGESWERAEAIEGMGKDEELTAIRAHRWRAGYVAAVTKVPGDPIAGRVYISTDCGQTWQLLQALGFQVHDVAWILRDKTPALLMACDKGLWERRLGATDPVQITIAGLRVDQGFWTVAVNADENGQPTQVAVAAQDRGGIWKSEEGGTSNTYISLSQRLMNKKDVRVLVWEAAGGRLFLWAGTYVFGADPGEGAFRWEGAAADWTQIIEGWGDGAGSCYSLAVCGETILAASYGQGVLWLDRTDPGHLVWKAAGRESGLPQQKPGSTPLAPMDLVWSVGGLPGSAIAMAATDSGVFRTSDRGASYESVAGREFRTSVPLPLTHLFCSGEHEIQVESEAN